MSLLLSILKTIHNHFHEILVKLYKKYSFGMIRKIFDHQTSANTGCHCDQDLAQKQSQTTNECKGTNSECI